MKYVCIFLIFTYNIQAQIMRCGIPNYVPKKGEAWEVTDTCGAKINYLYQGGNLWECQRWVFVQESAPQIQIVVAPITVRYRNTEWYKPSTGVRYYATTGTWKSENIVWDSLLIRNNLWTGKNTFSDSLTASKGLKSGDVIDTKGLNTEGAANKTALSINGVQSRKDTTITTNYTLNGLYGELSVITSATNITLTLPPLSNTGNWFWVVKKIDDDVGQIIIQDASSSVIYTIRNRMTISIKNVNNTWRRVQ